MKSFYLPALLIITGLTTGCVYNEKVKQEAGNETVDNSKYLIFFNKTAPVNDSSDIGVNWNVEKPIADFDLSGKNKLKYRFELLNDSIAALLQKVDEVWQEQDRFKFQPWQWIVTDTEIGSQFETKDFDYDGDEDVLCWVMSNVNGNEWTHIYLNNGNMLVKLHNTADDTDLWDMPTYNAKTRTIHTELFSSAYGIANTATYKLEGTTAVPIKKEEGDSATDANAIIYTTYTGENCKWKLAKTEIENIESEE